MKKNSPFLSVARGSEVTCPHCDKMFAYENTPNCPWCEGELIVDIPTVETPLVVPKSSEFKISALILVSIILYCVALVIPAYQSANPRETNDTPGIMCLALGWTSFFGGAEPRLAALIAWCSNFFYWFAMIPRAYKLKIFNWMALTPRGRKLGTHENGGPAFSALCLPLLGPWACMVHKMTTGDTNKTVLIGPGGWLWLLSYAVLFVKECRRIDPVAWGFRSRRE